MSRIIKERLLNAQSGTGASTALPFNGDVISKHNITVTTTLAGSALVLEVQDADGNLIQSHTASSAERTAKALVISLDGYPLTGIIVEVTTNTGMGNVTALYKGVQ